MASVVCNYPMWSRVGRPRSYGFRSGLWCVTRAVAVYVTYAHRAIDTTPPQSTIRAIRTPRSICLLLINQNGTYMLSSEL